MMDARMNHWDVMPLVATGATVEAAAKYLPPAWYDLSAILTAKALMAASCPSNPKADTDFNELRSFTVQMGYKINEQRVAITATLF